MFPLLILRLSRLECQAAGEKVHKSIEVMIHAKTSPEDRPDAMQVQVSNLRELRLHLLGLSSRAMPLSQWKGSLRQIPHSSSFQKVRQPFVCGSARADQCA